MDRVAFRLQLKLESLDEYVKIHEGVWPEMREALSATGWHNYSLFLDRTDGSLFGYCETEDFDLARSKMADLEVNKRWQKLMRSYFESLDGQNPDEGFMRLEQVFYLN
jgi:L-rhamnose mutarotase